MGWKTHDLVMVPRLAPDIRSTACAEENPMSARLRVTLEVEAAQLITTGQRFSCGHWTRKQNGPATVEPSASGPDHTSDTFVYLRRNPMAFPSESCYNTGIKRSALW
jgi:hypothetical protein